MPRRSRHDHRLETVTDAAVRRLRAATDDGRVVLAWDYPGSTLLEVRVLRSERGFAADPGCGASSGQTVVYDDTTGACRDVGLRNGRRYYYTVFARRPGDDWLLWERVALRPGRGRPGVAARVASWARRRLAAAARRPPLLAAVGLLTLSLVVVPASRAATPGAVESQQERALAVATADARVSDVLSGTGAAHTVDLLVPATADVSSDARADALAAVVTFGWPEAQARELTGTWPVLRRQSEGPPPVPLGESLDHRLVMSGLTSIAVVVDMTREQVVEIAPVDGGVDGHFTLHADTTPPFSWLTWYVDHPWLPLPLFAVAGMLLALRAYARSRAWRRRLPSMTRHDRQFIGRLTVVLFLLAGVVGQIWAVTAATRAVRPYEVSLGADTWALLPLLLFPAALYVAAIALEMTNAPHRAAWALLLLLAGGGCVYSAFAMTRTTTTDLTLLLSLLLGGVVLVAVPRAFTSGRMGWSRSERRTVM